jgi:hypothetical protein
VLSRRTSSRAILNISSNSVYEPALERHFLARRASHHFENLVSARLKSYSSKVGELQRVLAQPEELQRGSDVLLQEILVFFFS